MIDYVGRTHQIYQATLKESQEKQILHEKKHFERKKIK